MDGPLFLALDLGKSKGCAATYTHNRNIGCIFGQKCCDNIANMSSKRMSTEHQQYLALHFVKPKGCESRLTHNQTVGRLSRQQ